MAVAITIDERTSAAAAPQMASWPARIMVALALVAAFSVIGHSLSASTDFAERSQLNPNRLENRFAVRQSATQTSSVVGFLLLGGAGAICWSVAPRRRTGLNYGLLVCGAAYVGWCFASILWSIEPQLSVRKEGILALMLITGWGLASRFELEDLLWIFILVLTIFIGTGILAEIYHGTFRPWRSLYRFTGTIDANDQGLQCALLALAAMLAKWPGERDRPWLRGGLITMGLCGLWLSKSRTTLAAFVVAAAIALVFRARGTRRWMVLGGCLIAVCLGGILYSFVSVSVIGETAGVAAMGREDDVNTLTGRLPLWADAWKAAMHRPWMGHGYGAYWNAKHVLLYSDILSWHIPHAHNTYIDQVLAVGGIGLGLYVLWILASAAGAWARYERSGRGAELFTMCLLVLTLVHGATESKIPGAGVGAIMQLTFLAALVVQPPLVRLAVVAPPMARGRAHGRSTPWRRPPAPVPRGAAWRRRTAALPPAN
jgi:exopolysaccharide production protein ExoQ